MELLFQNFILIIFASVTTSYRNLGQLAVNLHEIAKSDKYHALWKSHWAQWRLAQDNAGGASGNKFGSAPLNCSSNGEALRSASVPTSVHALRPGDIKVVAAMGDSLTAAIGAGAQSLLEVLLEYRGLAFDIGGDGDLQYMVTIPNILRQFNPDVIGASSGVSPVWFSRMSGLNVAVAGAVAADMAGQAQELVRRIRNRNDINLTEDWKLVTIFVGANDLCSSCENQFGFGRRLGNSATNFRTNIQRALDILRSGLPRTLVNLVNVLHVEELRKTHYNNLFCYIVHTRECPCIIDQGRGGGGFFFGRFGRPPRRKNVSELVKQYQNELVDLVQSGDYDKLEHFTVVLQRFLENTVLPTSKLVNGREDIDVSVLSPDCFHWSQLGHSYVGRALWNGMLEPVGNKSTQFDVGNPAPLRCPHTACPFIRTSKNSENCSAYLPQETISPLPQETTETQETMETSTSVQNIIHTTETTHQETTETETTELFPPVALNETYTTLETATSEIATQQQETTETLETEPKNITETTIGVNSSATEISRNLREFMKRAADRDDRSFILKMSAHGGGFVDSKLQGKSQYSSHITVSAILGTILGVVMVSLVVSVMYKRNCTTGRRRKLQTVSGETAKDGEVDEEDVLFEIKQQKSQRIKPASETTPLLSNQTKMVRVF